MSAPLELMGAPGSPYTRKMLALLRYRRIPYAMLWGGHQRPAPGYPEPKVKLLPTFYFPSSDGGKDAVVDSTPIARRLERDVAGRSALPNDPALAFLNDLIEDYADEWLTKAMFHFRWAHEDDIANAGPLLIFWSIPNAPRENAEAMATAISKRQIDRLYVVGSNAVTAKTIEDSYVRLLMILDDIIEARGFVFGDRPATADFALYGQLTQLAQVEPTSSALTRRTAPRVRAWVDRVEDLSGLAPQDADWLQRGEARAALAPLLAEVGRVYAPFLIANARAAQAGQDSFEAEIDGRPWAQPTFAYQVKCLAALRAGFAALAGPDQAAVRDSLADTGCGALFN
ncbi:MAG: glutathione S-transferase [Alphaproteobacteria bacterium]|nr:glutathione S-transferase [Alphaproteobacteria bacterium]